MNTTISLMKLTGLSSFYPFSICVKTVLVGRLPFIEDGSIS